MYVGQTIPLDQAIDGLWGQKRVPITALISARNLTFEQNLLEKEGGAKTQNPANLLPSNIYALYDWRPDPLTQRMIAVTKAGAVYRDLGAWTFPTTVIAPGGITIGAQSPQLVAGGREVPGNNRKLFLFTGVSPVKVGSGDFTTMATIGANAPADWGGPGGQPSCGCNHAGRLVGALQHTIYWSGTADHEDFRVSSGGGLLPIAPGAGLFISAVYSYRQDMLVVFKYPRGIYIVDTSSPTPTNWFYYEQSLAVGAAGPLAVVGLPNDCLIVDPTLSLHLLSATNVLRDATASDISTPKLGQLIPQTFDATRSPFAQVVWYGSKRVAHVCLAANGSTVNNRRLLVDFNGAAQVGPRFLLSDRDHPESIILRVVSQVLRPFIGTDTGAVVALDQSSRDVDGAGYTGQFQTDHTDLGEVAPPFRGKRKNFDYLEVELAGVGDYNLSVNVYVDGTLRTPTPLLFNMKGSGTPLGAFVLGTSRLGTTTLFRARRRLTWSGTRISVEGLNTAPSQTFQISRLFIGARLAE